MILIAVRDAVLADSLRFSLELEGYVAMLCDELTLLPALAERPDCLVLDQDVFANLIDADGGGRISQSGVPVVLMVGQMTKAIVDRAKAAGVTRVVEKPLVGGILFEEIRNAVYGPNP